MGQTLFPAAAPTIPYVAEGVPVTISTGFYTTEDGTVTGCEFYAPSTVIGTFDAVLFSVTADDSPAESGTGTVLATATFGTLTPAANNQVMFSSPVAVTANTAYRIAVRTSHGRYTATPSFFNSYEQVSALGDLRAYAHGSTVGSMAFLANGSYIEGVASYPFKTYNANCYFVSPIFELDAGDPPNPLAGSISLPALQASGALAARGTVTAAVSLPALQASGVLAARSALAGALSVPHLTAAGTGVAGNVVTAAVSLPALQMSGAVSSRATLASALALPRLTLSGVLTVPIAPPEDTSSPNAPISTVSRPHLIATISRERVISTGSYGGA